MDSQWNELQQLGMDYDSVKDVAAYDRRMAEFRDANRENAEMLGMLALASGAAVLEMTAEHFSTVFGPSIIRARRITGRTS